MLAYLRGKGIPLTAYAPLAQGRAASDPTLAFLATSTVVVPLRWRSPGSSNQEGVIVIPKAARPESQKANLDGARHPARRRGSRRYRRSRKTSASSGRPSRQSATLSDEIHRRRAYRTTWRSPNSIASACSDLGIGTRAAKAIGIRRPIFLQIAYSFE